MARDRSMRLEEPCGRWSLLPLPENRAQAIVLAASGVVAAAPESDGRARAIAILAEGGAPAVLLATKVLMEALA
jgi:hypothetical protein